MSSAVALSLALLLLAAGSGEAARLRNSAAPLAPGAPGGAPHRRACAKGSVPLAFLAARQPGANGTAAPTASPTATNLGEPAGVFADGFSRAACDTDVAPMAERVYFKEHACGGVPSCALLETGMTPTICFDFCRQFEAAHFFGIENGRDCYCGRYFHAKSTGGGECDLPCMGDTKEMCGGKAKSSLFEMHMCDDSKDEAQVAADLADEAVAACTDAAKLGNSTAAKVKALADSWNLGVCSVKPEGERVCSLPEGWLKMFDTVTAEVHEATHAASVATSANGELTSASEAVVAAGEALTAEEASRQEASTRATRAAAIKAKSAADAANGAVAAVAGPFHKGKVLESFTDLYEPLGNVEKNWHAVCALVPVEGEAYAAVAADEPAVCAETCLGLSTGTDMCVGFNYQYKDGLAACQLLTGNGLVEPQISKAVPVFEVSASKLGALGIEKQDCYVLKSFMDSHPRGPLKTEVIRQSVVS